jgi:ribose 5-phosphate isomerase A
MSTNPKLLAARAALLELPKGDCVVGLGSGSTARIFIDEVGALVKSGRKITGVPTSDASREQARALGIPLLDDEGPWSIAVTVDGADEVDENLQLIKGGGGAHAREKIVNYSSARNVIIVDASKISKNLGEKWPIPVEVLRFAHRATASHLSRFGSPKLRMRGADPFVTDAGNFIYDVNAGTIADPASLDQKLHAVPGVVETGFFIARADIVLVADESGVRKLVRK